MTTLRIGLIADTHGLLRPEAVEALRGVDAIVHAGDVGKPAVLAALAELAPVHAIRGNVDAGDWAAALPDTLTLALGGVTLYVLHDLKLLPPGLDGIDVVIAGHSHQPRIERRDGRLIVNPGSAGPRRFKLPVSVGHLDIRDGVASAQLCTLAV
ncbi:MAG: metallophosphoesterase family protein [Burkholderiaceae bacterium]